MIKEWIQKNGTYVKTYKDGHKLYSAYDNKDYFPENVLYGTTEPSFLCYDNKWPRYYNTHYLGSPPPDFVCYGIENKYFMNGERHRTDGPAVEYIYESVDHTKYINPYIGNTWIDKVPNTELPDKNEWHVHGEKIPCNNQEEFERLMKLRAFW